MNSGFDLSLVIRDPEIESRCRNALQGRRRDLSSQEASLIASSNYKTICTDPYSTYANSEVGFFA